MKSKLWGQVGHLPPRMGDMWGQGVVSQCKASETRWDTCKSLSCNQNVLKCTDLHMNFQNFLAVTPQAPCRRGSSSTLSMATSWPWPPNVQVKWYPWWWVPIYITGYTSQCSVPKWMGTLHRECTTWLNSTPGCQ